MAQPHGRTCVEESFWGIGQVGGRRRLTVADLRWADLILVMEEKHRSRIRAEHRDEVRYKALHVLDIPDDYQFMQPELIELLRLKVAPFIQEATRA